ncbi:MAG: AAA family ATPase [Rhodobacteraceae bacterium]|nr:AAA family ATPase [Paracoccaceae bacterium]
MTRDSAERTVQLDTHRTGFPREQAGRLPTAFVWRDPSTIPPRPWLYGHHLIRKQVSVTVAPGGVGKSSLTICEGLAMASGRELLGDWTANNLKVWIYNLEDPRDELDRRIIAAMQHHNVRPDEITGKLFVDTGRERALSTAVQTREGVQIIKPEMDALAHEIEVRGIDVLVIDPFVSSHQVSENDNGAIDLVAKEWARLADRCNCAIELVHHTRKTNGEEATTESGRGASALLSAARSGRVLNKMNDEMKAEAGVQDDPATYFAVTRDKANLAPVGKREWRRMASVHLSNGDSVGVAEIWKWPHPFDGVTVKNLLSVQHAIEGKHPRYSDQAGDDWAGCIVADVLGMDTSADRKRLKRIIETWLKSGALVKVKHKDANRIERPCLEVGEWATV